LIKHILSISLRKRPKGGLIDEVSLLGTTSISRPILDYKQMIVAVVSLSRNDYRLEHKIVKDTKVH